MMSSCTGQSLPPKRTRTNVHQSKNGCYTCRSRRLKCDESMPFCQRCKKAGKHCEGYRPVKAVADGNVSKKQELSPSFSARNLSDSSNSIAVSHFLKDPSVIRYSRLGLGVLDDGSDQDQFSTSSVTWTTLLRSFCRSSPTVYAASAALGAMYEAFSTSTDAQSYSDSTIKVPYTMALALLRKDISLQNHNPSALLVASVVLASVEVLQRNLTNALMHIRGAFKVYTEYIQDSSTIATSPFRRPIDNTEEQALSLFVQRLDLQNVTYKLSNSLDLPFCQATQGGFNHTLGLDLVDTAESELITLLHGSYSFTSRASNYKYLPRSCIPPDVVLQQRRYVAQLHKWLATTESQSQVSLGTLRMQCFSAIIYLASILNPHETTFDAFEDLFRQVVDEAKTILSNRLTPVCQGRVPFRPVSSLSQPLFLTAMKCRKPVLRRRAIALLRQTGREGPWDAQILVAVAERAVAIEEQWRDASVEPTEQLELQQGHGDREDHHSTQNVPEQARLHGCGMGYITTDSGAPVDGVIPDHASRDPRTIEFRFRRCWDIEKMLEAHEGSSDVWHEESEHWEVWDERIELSHHSKLQK